jgi:hypothetical protein
MPQDELVRCVEMPTGHYIVDGEGSSAQAYIKTYQLPVDLRMS